MNSDKQGRAMCACAAAVPLRVRSPPPLRRSAGAAPHPARLHPLKTSPPPSPRRTLPGTGFLRLRSFAASNAQPGA